MGDSRRQRRQPPTIFEYPHHLRADAEALPAAPGVYLFHGAPGEDGRAALPLYIGKSVDLRARVLAHLRNADEAAMLRQARHISHERTAGELGALLREAQLVKQRQPLFNRQLRRTRQLCAVRLDDASGAGHDTPSDPAPRLVFSGDVDFARTPGLHGLFASRRAAVDALHALADAERLCLGLLGLEPLAPGRGCFRASLRRCAGACHGDEPLAAHAVRLRAALAAWRVVCWPWPGAVGLVERDGDFTQVSVVRDWCYLGSAPDLDAARRLDRAASGAAVAFDADVYRLLLRPLLAGTPGVEVVTWDPPAG